MVDFDPHCSRCGCQLKVVLFQVRVPIMNPTPITWADEIPNSNPIAYEYEQREEISDCPRCTGSY